jgi:hypothetical protein
MMEATPMGLGDRGGGGFVSRWKITHDGFPLAKLLITEEGVVWGTAGDGPYEPLTGQDPDLVAVSEARAEAWMRRKFDEEGPHEHG